jgi:hypothetical protein
VLFAVSGAATKFSTLLSLDVFAEQSRFIGSGWWFKYSEG